MAIYPYTNTYVINKDVVAGSTFKAGMVLMLNSDGKAVPADSQLLVFDSLGQKQAKILGLAAGDSNLTGNTIIVPDVVGNNYLDSNKNFVEASNAEYIAIRRQLLDYADETINEYYNMNFSPKPKKRGIGVYSLTGDTFATDQFKAVLHGDYGIDGTDTISFSPGDLLTFGGGVNAGKLVKVNNNSIGPDVVVVGIVEKYNSNIGLLYFRYVFDNLSLGYENSLKLSLDAANPNSFTSPSSTTAIDMAGTNNGTLINGVAYDSIDGATWSFDGTNDYINITVTNMTLNNASFTAMCWVNLSLPTNGTFFHLGDGNNGIAVGVGFNSLDNDGSKFIMLYPIVRWVNNSYNMGTYNSGWNFVAVTSDISKNTITYLNNNSGVSVGVNDSNLPGSNIITLGRCNESVTTRYLNGKLSIFNLYNRALSASEILAYYNYTKSRYGL